MARRIINLEQVLALSELTVTDLKSEYKETNQRYHLAIERLEFLYSRDLKEDLKLIRKEMDNRKIITIVPLE